MKFYNKVCKIDKILEGEVNEQTLMKLNVFLKSTSLQNYFWYSLLRKPEWFSLLNEEGYFEILNQKSSNDELYITQSLVSEYLLNVAHIYPAKVIKIIKNTETDNERIIWNFVRIGLSIRPKYTAKMIRLVKKWANNLRGNSTLFDSLIIKWVKYLSSEGHNDSAFNLVKILITPKIQKPSGKRNEEVEKVLGKERPIAVTLIDYYYLNELLFKGFNVLIENNPFRFSELLQKSLEKAIKIEYSYIKKNIDLSYMWRPAVEDHQQNQSQYDLKTTIFNVLRAAMELVIRQDKEFGLGIIKNYLKHKYSIFRRLAIHLMRLNYDSYSYFVNEFIKNKKHLNDINISHEYYILLRDIFPNIDPRERNDIIESIKRIKNYDPGVKPEDQKKQIKYNHLERLHFLEEYLEGDYKKYYDDLKLEFQGEKIRDTVVWSESYIGEKSPLTLEEIEAMDIKELWDYLKSFKKNSHSYDEPSPEGLARNFAAAVKRNPEKYLNHDLSTLVELKPNYSYWLLNNITEMFKENYLELKGYIPNLLDFISKIIKNNNISIDFIDNMGINFSGVKKRGLDFIQALIKNHQKEFELNHKDKIWEIIYYLNYNSHDVNEYKSQLDPFTYAINSVKGSALIAVIDYALWYAYQTKDNHTEKNPNRLQGEERVIKLLEDKLINKNLNKSLAIHSIFGIYFANLSYLNFTWVKEHIKNIFNKDNFEYWEVAWSGYVSSTRFYSDLYKVLTPEFHRAIQYLQKGIKINSLGLGRTPEDALSEHLIIANINGLDDINNEKSLLRKFAYVEDNPASIHAVQFIANLARDEKIFFDIPGIKRKSFWDKAKKFWKIRIEVVKPLIKKKKVDNLKDKYDQEFSRYISWLDDLPETVKLKELESLLIGTLKINGKGLQVPNLIKFLYKHSQEYPIIAIGLLDKTMQTKAPLYFYQGKEKEIELILETAIRSNNLKGKRLAEKIANKFGEQGNYYFKELWLKYFSKNNQ
ncbi:MAG TPA: hypothetical protein VFF33_13425 [Ignavibacteriaceae bacterium]|nr:hypothetical protein [Ignavibacteriaceae bacterium]